MSADPANPLVAIFVAAVHFATSSAGLQEDVGHVEGTQQQIAPTTDNDDPHSEQERERLEQRLHEWEREQAELYDQLVTAINEKDKLSSYHILKKLHGGGAGVSGSRVELLLKEAKAHEKHCEDIKTNQEKVLSIIEIPGRINKKRYDDVLEDFERSAVNCAQHVEAKIDEAFDIADDIIAEELIQIFELMAPSGPPGNTNDD